jgi:hypothetical protein
VQNAATSLNLDGLFRTRSELSLLNGLQERLGGVGAELSAQNWSFGFSTQYIFYDKPIVSRSVQVFFGQNGMNTSVYGTYQMQNFLVSAELGLDGRNNLGGRINAEYALTNLRLATSARVFSTDFRAPFGVLFGENSKPTNEAGLYVGAAWKADENVRVNSYVDVYTTVSSTATVPVPVRGVDIFTETTWRSADDILWTFRARHETKTDALTLGTGRNRQRVIFGRGKTSLRVQGQFDVLPELRIQSRLEGVLVNFQDAAPLEKGVLGFLGMQWNVPNTLSVSARVVGFFTDSFDSALWQYEQTIAGTLSNPPLYGQGIRAYCLIETGIIPACLLSVRGSLTRRFDVSTLGSGSTLINSNTDAQLLVQIDVRL